MFNKDLLAGDGRLGNTITLKYSSAYNWADSNANVYVGFRGEWPWEYWIKMDLDSANQQYTATIPSGWENNPVTFVRMSVTAQQPPLFQN